MIELAPSPSMTSTLTLSSNFAGIVALTISVSILRVSATPVVTLMHDGPGPNRCRSNSRHRNWVSTNQHHAKSYLHPEGMFCGPEECSFTCDRPVDTNNNWTRCWFRGCVWFSHRRLPSRFPGLPG